MFAAHQHHRRFRYDHSSPGPRVIFSRTARKKPLAGLAAMDSPAPWVSLPKSCTSRAFGLPGHLRRIPGSHRIGYRPSRRSLLSASLATCWWPWPWSIGASAYLQTGRAIKRAKASSIIFSRSPSLWPSRLRAPAPFPSTVLFPNSDWSADAPFSATERSASVGPMSSPPQVTGEFMRRKFIQALAAIVLFLSARLPLEFSSDSTGINLPANVDASRLINADQQPGNWMSYGAPTVSSASVPSSKSAIKTSANSHSPGTLTWTPIVARKQRPSSSTGDVLHNCLEQSLRRESSNGREALVLRSQSPSRVGYQRLLRCRPIAGLPLGRGKFSSLHWMAVSLRSTQPPENRSGKLSPSTRITVTPSPARRAS